MVLMILMVLITAGSTDLWYLMALMILMVLITVGSTDPWY